ncbi:MAG: pyridoxal-phosphate dependent enzyme, partial [Acholeplasmatales bacterium]|nr:pyridoxal-phosphate dependent enzyme [Acholeplasmatales bacterium]
MYNSSLELIGNGPLILLKHIMKKYGFEGNLYAKYEGFNLTGSIKDKAVLMIIKDLEEKNLLRPGMTIVESTSGNTGISLALIGHLLG